MKTLVLTPGDPTGIGPEITIKALQHAERFEAHLIVVGSRHALTSAASAINQPLPQNSHIEYQDIEADSPGAVAYQALDLAVRLISEKKASALVTGPISKKHLHKAGFDFGGHTEILEHLANLYFGGYIKRDETSSQEKRFFAEMLFVYKSFRLLLLTRHIPLKDVPSALGQQGAVARPLKTLISYLRHDLEISEPKIAMLAINPHAGEIGGDEENKFYAPVIKAVNAIGATQLQGPFAADGFFRNFKAEDPGFDAVVAAYHDQGLIPFKLLAGFDAVNVTIGLPFLRTSVSHGTADDIVGKGIAKEDSLVAAIKAALP